MKISKEARKVSRELFQASLVDGRLDAGKVQSLTRRVGELKPRHYMDILHAYGRLVRLEVARHQALVESATPLDDATRGEMETSLRAKYGPDVTATFTVVPELIGGLRVKIGSDVFDSTVRERLSRLESQSLHA